MFLLGVLCLVSTAASLPQYAPQPPVTQEILVDSHTNSDNLVDSYTNSEGLTSGDKNYAQEVAVSTFPPETELKPVGPVGLTTMEVHDYDKPEESMKSTDSEEPKTNENKGEEPKEEIKYEDAAKTDESNIPDKEFKGFDADKLVIINLEVQDIPIITRFKGPRRSPFSDMNIPFSLLSILNHPSNRYISYSYPDHRYSGYPYEAYEEPE